MTTLSPDNQKKYLSKYKRDKKKPSFVFTERDFEILKAVDRFRYMQTSQIKRLVFPENKTIQSTRRRLKYLYHNGFLGRIIPFVQIGNGEGEIAYFVDRKGFDLLEGQGVEPCSYSKNTKVKHQFLKHALDLSDFRLNLELALKGNPVIGVHRFTCDFELKTHTINAVGRKIYKLFDEVVHPVNHQRYVVYPDALIILKGKGKYEKFQRLYFLEVDRGTEKLDMIRDKVIGYNIYKREGIFHKFGKFNDFKVLIQTTSEKRAKNMRKYLTDLEGTELVWITHIKQVSEKTIVGEAIWQDYRLCMCQVLKSS